MPTISEHEAAALSAFHGNVESLARVELERLEAERVELQQALNSVKAALKSVRAVINASTPKERKPRKAKATNGKVNEFVPSEERAAMFANWIAKQKDDTEITSTVVNKRFPDWSRSYVQFMLKWARENGLLRKSGQTGTTILYRKLG